LGAQCFSTAHRELEHHRGHALLHCHKAQPNQQDLRVEGGGFSTARSNPTQTTGVIGKNGIDLWLVRFDAGFSCFATHASLHNTEWFKLMRVRHWKELKSCIFFECRDSTRVLV
jgi:hypothetical protein